MSSTRTEVPIGAAWPDRDQGNRYSTAPTRFGQSAREPWHRRGFEESRSHRPEQSLANEIRPALGCLALREDGRFATGLEYGVTLAFVCWVLPLEPDDLAPAGVVIQSNPGSE